MPLDKTFSVVYQNWIKRYFCRSRKPNESTLTLRRLLKSVKYIKFNIIDDKRSLDVLFKSDARSEGKYMAILYRTSKRCSSSNPSGGYRRHIFTTN